MCNLRVEYAEFPKGEWSVFVEGMPVGISLCSELEAADIARWISESGIDLVSHICQMKGIREITDGPNGKEFILGDLF